MITRQLLDEKSDFTLSGLLLVTAVFFPIVWLKHFHPGGQGGLFQISLWTLEVWTEMCS